MIPEVRAAIGAHLRQGKYPKPNTLSEYLIKKGVQCSPQEALAYIQEYRQGNMVHGDPDLVAYLKNKPSELADVPPETEFKTQPAPPFNRDIFRGIPIPNQSPRVTQTYEPAKIQPQVITERKNMEKLKPQTFIQKVLHFVETVLLDTGALIIALVVDILMNIVVFYTIAFDTATRVGMVSLAFVVVLFSVRAWIKGGWQGRALWAMFALIASFSDVSLALATTQTQATHIVYDATKDQDLISLQTQATKDSQYLDDLRSKQIAEGSGFKSQIEAAVTQYNTSSLAVKNYKPKSDAIAEEYISSSKVFTAIPDALMSGKTDREIALFLFVLLFTALQLTIVSSASNALKKED